jgi:virginiamycin A acetyltransferase
MVNKKAGIIIAILIAPFYLIRKILVKSLQSMQEALIRGYFRVAYKASVHTRNISLAAKLGKFVTIGKDCVVGKNVSIGDYTYLNERTSVDSGSIGKFCSIASGVSIGPLEHPTYLLSTHPATFSEPKFHLIKSPINIRLEAPPIIGNDVWIGRNAVIRRGVVVGNGSVIGANSVVCDSVPVYSIVGGIPSRVIRSRFSAELCDVINKSEWWDNLERVDQLTDDLAKGKAV